MFPHSVCLRFHFLIKFSSLVRSEVLLQIQFVDHLDIFLITLNPSWLNSLELIRMTTSKEQMWLEIFVLLTVNILALWDHNWQLNCWVQFKNVSSISCSNFYQSDDSSWLCFNHHSDFHENLLPTLSSVRMFCIFHFTLSLYRHNSKAEARTEINDIF